MSLGRALEPPGSLLLHLLLDRFHINVLAPVVHVLKAQHVANLLVRQRRFIFFHLPRDLDVRVIPLQDVARGFDRGNGVVCSVEDLAFAVT
jgi:hypothetical protein